MRSIQQIMFQENVGYVTASIIQDNEKIAKCSEQLSYDKVCGIHIGQGQYDNGTRHTVAINGETVYDTHDERDATLFKAQLMIYKLTLRP